MNQDYNYSITQGGGLGSIGFSEKNGTTQSVDAKQSSEYEKIVNQAKEIVDPTSRKIMEELNNEYSKTHPLERDAKIEQTQVFVPDQTDTDSYSEEGDFEIIDDEMDNDSEIRDQAIQKEETATVKEETGAVKEETGAVKEEIGAVKEEIGAVKEEIGAVKEKVGAVKEKVGADNEEVGAVKEETGAVKEAEGSDEVKIGTNVIKYVEEKGEQVQMQNQQIDNSVIIEKSNIQKESITHNGVQFLVNSTVKEIEDRWKNEFVGEAQIKFSTVLKESIFNAVKSDPSISKEALLEVGNNKAKELVEQNKIVIKSKSGNFVSLSKEERKEFTKFTNIEDKNEFIDIKFQIDKVLKEVIIEYKDFSIGEDQIPCDKIIKESLKKYLIENPNLSMKEIEDFIDDKVGQIIKGNVFKTDALGNKVLLSDDEKKEFATKLKMSFYKYAEACYQLHRFQQRVSFERPKQHSHKIFLSSKQTLQFLLLPKLYSKESSNIKNVADYKKFPDEALDSLNNINIMVKKERSTLEKLFEEDMKKTEQWYQKLNDIIEFVRLKRENLDKLVDAFEIIHKELKKNNNKEETLTFTEFKAVLASTMADLKQSLAYINQIESDANQGTPNIRIVQDRMLTVIHNNIKRSIK